MLVATAGIDRDTGILRTGPDLVSRGFIEPELSEELMAEAREAVAAAIRGAGRRPDPTLLQEAIHDALSRLVWKRTRRRPMVIPVLTEL
jgi:ribonuclease J